MEYGKYKMIEDINKVEVKKIEKMCDAFKKGGIKKVSFETIIGSLFPSAYKNIDEVMEYQKDLVKILVKLSPLGVVKALAEPPYWRKKGK